MGPVGRLLHLSISFRFLLRITHFQGTYKMGADGNHLEVSSGDNSYIMEPVQRGSDSYLMVDGIFYALAAFDIQESGRQRSLSHVSVLMFGTDSDEIDHPAAEGFRPLDAITDVEC